MQTRINVKLERSKNIGNILRRKVKTSMMHIVDLLKAHVSAKPKKSSKKNSSSHNSIANSSVCASINKEAALSKPRLIRKLTADQITEAELALKRLQAEKKRLEDLLNSSSDRHITRSTYQAEDVSSTNNNVRKEIVRLPRYQQKVAFILHDVFTSEECKMLLQELETNKSDCKKTQVGEISTTHSEDMAKRLWPVLQNEVPKTMMGNKLLGLSNRCILEKQGQGYSRLPHMDEVYEPVEGREKSFVSVYVFLNDDYEGGQSSFLKNWQPSSQDVKVKPKQGSILIQQHNLLHEVTPITSGEKHIVRYDIMYNTSKRDILSEMFD